MDLMKREKKRINSLIKFSTSGILSHSLEAHPDAFRIHSGIYCPANYEPPLVALKITGY